MARVELTGVAASPGVGYGRALVMGDAPGAGADEAPDGRDARVRDPVVETARLQRAVDAAAAELLDLAARVPPDAGPAARSILEAQSVMARDPALLRAALDAVATGIPAARAVRDSTEAQARLLEGLHDARFRARAADVRDVGARIVAWLGDRDAGHPWHADGAPAVIVARDLAPSQTVTLRPERVAAMALAGGAVAGHAAIVARALGLPLVVELGAALLEVATDSMLVVDGGRGCVLVDPDADELRALSHPRP